MERHNSQTVKQSIVKWFIFVYVYEYVSITFASRYSILKGEIYFDFRNVSSCSASSNKRLHDRRAERRRDAHIMVSKKQVGHDRERDIPS